MLSIGLFVARIVAATVASPVLFALTLVPELAAPPRRRAQSLFCGLLVMGILGLVIVYGGIASGEAPRLHEVASALAGAFSIGASGPVVWSALFHSRTMRPAR
jgi:hypothetical protein